VNRSKIARDVLLRRFGLERSYRPHALLRHPEWNFHRVMKLVVAYYLRLRPNLSFLQVGAFDGLVEDPIHPLVQEFRLRGIVVEPQAQLFATLQKNYATHPQVVPVQAAIADTNGTRDFYTTTLGPSRKASFFKSHLLREGVPPHQIARTSVRCVTMASVVQEHGFERCDLIQIDAEGYDYQIVRTIDFEALNPLIVRFEHAHMTDDECTECIALLASRNFRFISERRDITAVRDP
jgi:FkbM family methyltransferase